MVTPAAAAQGRDNQQQGDPALHSRATKNSHEQDGPMPAPLNREVSTSLIQTAMAVDFQLLEHRVLEAPDPAEFGMRIVLHLGDPDDEFDETVEWGGLAFLYVLAALSFSDARGRGFSESEFEAGDEFEVGDLVSMLSFVRGELHVRADYVRGRRMKTDLTLRQDGTLILETIGRGQAPLRWIDRMLGKTPLAAVPGGASPGSESDGTDACP
jgi:hypothetical protein